MSRKKCKIITEIYKGNNKSCGEDFVGDKCSQAEITKSLLYKLCGEEVETPKLILTNQMVLELNTYRMKWDTTWKDMVIWVQSILVSKPEILNEKNLRQVVKRLKAHVGEIIKKRKKEEHELLLKDEFKLPATRISDPPAPGTTSSDQEDETVLLLENYATQIDELVSELESCNQQVDFFTQIITEQGKEETKSKSEIVRLQSELKKITRVEKKKSDDLQRAMETVGKLRKQNLMKKT